MSYGPTRNKLDPLIGTRVRRLLHLDLVPGLQPAAARPSSRCRAETVPTTAFLKVLGELSGGRCRVAEVAAEAEPWRCCSASTSPRCPSSPRRQEEDLHVRMLRGAVGRGHRRSSSSRTPRRRPAWSRALEREAEQLGVRAHRPGRPLLAEVLYERSPPRWWWAASPRRCSRPRAFYGIPVARIGTELLLDRLAPYQNSNRVPVTIADALLPAAGAGARRGRAVDLAGLLAAVGYAMQPRAAAGPAAGGRAVPGRHLDAHTWRYFKRRRLTSLGLPGAIPAQLAFIPRNATVRRVARRVRGVVRRGA